MFVDQGGPFECKIVDIGPPMDVALDGSYRKDEYEAQKNQIQALCPKSPCLTI